MKHENTSTEFELYLWFLALNTVVVFVSNDAHYDHLLLNLLGMKAGYPAPGLFSSDFFLSLFLRQQHYEKTAGPICMKFSGKVCSDRETT